MVLCCSCFAANSEYVPCPRLFIRIRGQQLRFALRIRVFQKLAQDCRLIEWLVLVLQSGHQAAGIEIQKGLRLVVRVYLDVLIGNAFFFQCDPDALDEGAEPAGVEFKGVFGLVSLGRLESGLESWLGWDGGYFDGFKGETCCLGVEVCVRVVFAHVLLIDGLDGCRE
jgi:hypothetical protein